MDDKIVKLIEDDPDNKDFIMMDFDELPEVDLEYITWFLAHGNNAFGLGDNLLSYEITKGDRPNA